MTNHETQQRLAHVQSRIVRATEALRQLEGERDALVEQLADNEGWPRPSASIPAPVGRPLVDRWAIVMLARSCEIRAERKAGELLAKMEKHNGDPRSHDVTRLDDLGISKIDSHRWQIAASVPSDAPDSTLSRSDAIKV